MKLNFIAISLMALTMLFASCKKTEEVTPVASPDVKTYSFDINMAYLTTVNANPACFIDLDKGVVYTVPIAPLVSMGRDTSWKSFRSQRVMAAFSSGE